MKTTAALLSAFLFCAMSVSASSRCLAVQTSVPSKELPLTQQDQELLAAVCRTDLKAVNSLLEQGANVNPVPAQVRNSKGKLIPYRIYHLPTLLMKAILNTKESPTRTALIQTLLDHGADPNGTGFISNERACPITVALKNMNNQIATVYQLLEHGADPNLMISKGFPIGGVEWEYIAMPVFHYSLCGYWHHFSDADRVALLSVMLAHGAQPNLRDANGNTALLRVTRDNLWDAVPLLLTHHADVNAKNREGATALCYATSSLPTARLLLSNGAKVNVRDSEGKTPLMLAGYDVAMIRLLLDHGADVNIKDHYGETALSTLRDEEETPEVRQVIALLKEVGAKDLPVNCRRRLPHHTYRTSCASFQCAHLSGTKWQVKCREAVIYLLIFTA